MSDSVTNYNYVGDTKISLLIKQEGPKGPGSVTCGKDQRSQWSHLLRTTNVVQQILVEDLMMMLDIKYESPGPCSFRREDFENCNLKTYFLTS